MASFIAMASSVRIRGYRRADERVVHAIARDGFEEYGAGAEQHIARLMARRHNYTWVATLDRQAAGFAILNAASGSLDAIAVAAEHRGSGIGGLLLDAVIRDARARRLTELQLVTAQSNVAALSLFQRVGFEILERRRRFYRAGQDAVVLRRFLSDDS